MSTIGQAWYLLSPFYQLPASTLLAKGLLIEAIERVKECTNMQGLQKLAPAQHLPSLGQGRQ